MLIGLGASAISDAKYAYAQNTKKVEDYLIQIKENASAVSKGHILSEEDLLLKECILQICCNARLSQELLMQVITPTIVESMRAMENEGILYLDDKGLHVTTVGQPFIRNICSVFDRRMIRDDKQPIFSKAI